MRFYVDFYSLCMEFIAHKMHSMDKVFLRLESVCKLPIVCSAQRKTKTAILLEGTGMLKELLEVFELVDSIRNAFILSL